MVVLEMKRERERERFVSVELVGRGFVTWWGI